MIPSTQISLSGSHVGSKTKSSKKGQMSNRRAEELVNLELDEDGFYTRECARCGSTYASKSPIGPRDCSHDAHSSLPCALPWAVGGPISGMLEGEA